MRKTERAMEGLGRFFEAWAFEKTVWVWLTVLFSALALVSFVWFVWTSIKFIKTV